MHIPVEAFVAILLLAHFDTYLINYISTYVGEVWWHCHLTSIRILKIFQRILPQPPIDWTHINLERPLVILYLTFYDNSY